MARIRTIKPEFWSSEQITSCGLNARLFFIGLLNFCDDDGVHPEKPRQLRGRIFANDDVTADDVQGWIHELIAAKLVSRFQVDGENYLQVPTWHKHQRIDRPTYKYPPPPERSSMAPRRLGNSMSVTSRPHLDEESPNPPRPVCSGEEGKGKELCLATSLPPKKSQDKTTRASRLPQDWLLPDDWRIEGTDLRPDLDLDITADGFRDYWISQPGQRGLKLDWRATWRNWLRGQHAPRHQPSRLSKAADPLAVTEQF